MKSQEDLTPEKGGGVLRDALALGVNFWDTSASKRQSGSRP